MNGPEDSVPDPSNSSSGPRHPLDEAPTSEWDSDEALSCLTEERKIRDPDASTLEWTKKMLEEAAPLAAQSIIQIARSASNDNTRFAASRYIVDLVTASETEDGRAAWEKLVGDVVDRAEILANAFGSEDE